MMKLLLKVPCFRVSTSSPGKYWFLTRMSIPYFNSDQQTFIRSFTRCVIFRKEGKGNDAKSETLSNHQDSSELRCKISDPKTTEVKDVLSTRQTSDGIINHSAKMSETEVVQLLWFQSGQQRFKPLVDMTGFIDKSLLIEAVLTHPPDIGKTPYRPVYYITAPSRFGKSTNLDMLKTFLEIKVDQEGKMIEGKKNSNYKLFDKLKIMDHQDLVKEHFGNHPVISLDFKAPTISKPEDVLDHCRVVLRRAFQQHKYLLKKEVNLNVRAKALMEWWCGGYTFVTLPKDIVNSSLRDLCECLYEHFGRKVFILVDEYDAIANAAMLRLTEAEVVAASRCLMAMLDPCIKGGEDYVQGAVLTGISYFAGIVGISDDLNNVVTCRFLHDHKFVEFYGLTEAEVKYLADKKARAYGMDSSDLLNKYQQHYNGYTSQKGIKIYSTWSVGISLQENDFRGFWINTCSFNFMEEMLKETKIRLLILALLAGKNIPIMICQRVNVGNLITMRRLFRSGQVIPNPDILFSLMLEEGYLSLADLPGQKNQEFVRIPNLEITNDISYHIKLYYLETRRLDKGKLAECASFFNRLVKFNTDSEPHTDSEFEFKEELQEFCNSLQNLAEKMFKDTTEMNEDHLHNALYIVFRNTDFAQYGTNHRTRKGTTVGYSDLVMVHKNKFGIILVLKYNQKKKGQNSGGDPKKTSKAGLAQILVEKTDYTSILTEKKIEKYLLMSISIDAELKLSISYSLNSKDLKDVVNVDPDLTRLNQDSLHFY